eukprot:scaffold1963_cov120-Isochrysis_galbana.AAC.3
MTAPPDGHRGNLGCRVRGRWWSVVSGMRGCVHGAQSSSTARRGARGRPGWAGVRAREQRAAGRCEDAGGGGRGLGQLQDQQVESERGWPRIPGGASWQPHARLTAGRASGRRSEDLHLTDVSESGQCACEQTARESWA